MQRAKQYLFDISYQFLSKSKELRACGVLKQACEIPTIDKLDLGLQSEAQVSQRVSNVIQRITNLASKSSFIIFMCFQIQNIW